MEINPTFLLCIGLACLYFMDVHAGVEMQQKQIETNTDAISQGKYEEDYHMMEDHPTLEDSGKSEVIDEDIDLEEVAQQGELVTYQHVVIMFCKAMNAELEMEEKSPPVQIDGILQQLYNFTPQDKHPDNMNLEEIEDLLKIFQLAEQSLNYYENLLLGEKRSYVVGAYYFRLLLWLKYNMRSEPDQPNKFVEPKIDEILQPRYDDAQPRNLEAELFPQHLVILRDECLAVRTLKALKNFGRTMDDSVYLFLQLAKYDGNIDQVEPRLTYLIPTLNQYMNREYCERMRQAMGTLLAALSYDFKKFETEFQKQPEEILLYINEIIHHTCKIEYKRANSKIINLKHLGDATSIHHLRDTMILYSGAIEQKLLLEPRNEETMKIVLQIENFPIGNEKCREIETNALLTLSFNLIQFYHDDILKPYGQMITLDGSLELYYSRLIIWLYRQISRVNSNQLHTYSVLYELENIWKNLSIKEHSDVSLNSLMDKSYDEIATLDAIINFGEMPLSSAITTQHELMQHE